jgi:hypothetical protein
MSDIDYAELNRKNIENWKKKTRRKGTFYLYKKEKFEKYGDVGFSYSVIWYEKNTDKTKFGGFRDHMMTRHGVATWATLTGSSPTGLWQTSNGEISDEELAAMIKVAKGETSEFEIFDVDQLEGLRT